MQLHSHVPGYEYEEEITASLPLTRTLYYIIMASAKDDLGDPERRIQQLEDSIDKLRKALKRWQTLEVDYEALNEDVSDLGDRLNESTAVGRAHLRSTDDG